MELTSESEPLLTIEDDGLGRKKKTFIRRVFPSGIKSELLSVLKIAVPVVVTNLSMSTITTEGVIFSGHISKYHLDGVALANSIIAVLGFSICIGFNTACDTILSQIFGSKHKKSMGMILQRGFLIITIPPIILIGIQINSEPLFLLLNQDPNVSVIAARFLTIFSPGILFIFYFLLFARYMQTQNRVYAPMVIGIIVNIINILLQLVFVQVLGYGADATAICQMITYMLFTVLEVFYILYSGLYKDTWNGFTRDAFLNWSTFLSLAIPGALMIMLESFCFEIGTFLSGIMNPVQQAIQSILYQIESIIFMICFGVGVAVNIRVAQALGGKDHEKALTAYRCGLLLIFIIQVVTGSIVISMYNSLPRLFTNDPEVIAGVSEILPYLVGVQLIDAIGTVTNGALRGCGKQKWCVFYILFSYYILGLPIGVYLAFGAGFQVKGIWIGIFIALCVCVPAATIYTNCIQNWKRQAENCSVQLEKTTAIKEQREKEEVQFVESLTTVEHRRSLSRDFMKVHGAELLAVQSTVISDGEFRRVYLKRSLVFLVSFAILLACILVRVFVTEGWIKLNVTTTSP